MNEAQRESVLENLVSTFVARAAADLRERRESWRLDLQDQEIHEVLGGLLSRQVNIATQLATAPSTWNPHVAPLFLRAMADVHISLVWILGNPRERARKFILFGLGQLKLEIEHRRAAQEDEESQEEGVAIEAMQEWLNRQRVHYLTEVNLGSWSGLSTREMAEEAGCIDFYNYVYTPFSACVHSMWHHIARFDLVECSNPLHRYHRVPLRRDFTIDLNYLYLAGKYLHKSLKTFDNEFGLNTTSPTTFFVLCDAINDLSGQAEGNEDGSNADEVPPRE